MTLLVLNAFLSAFLLFQIQPITGKLLLPLFGGGASIWSATMLSFQLLLLAGYVYAWLATRFLSFRAQRCLHLGLLLCSVLLILWSGFKSLAPVFPVLALEELGKTYPVLTIVLLICSSVGLPYFLLASNSTVMHVTLARRGIQNPYWLYSFSNAGSCLALITYPFIIEPYTGIVVQGWIWACVYIFFAVLSTLILRVTSIDAEPGQTASPGGLYPFSIPLTLALSFLPAMMLLAVTAYASQEIAPVPFLWVVPLFLYLLSFIITFGTERAYNRTAAKNFLFVACSGFVIPALDLNVHITTEISLVFLLFFIISWFCHGELYRMRPGSEGMQFFYVILAAGGAGGGFFVSVIAPHLFDRYYEYYLGVGLAWLLYGAVSYRSAVSVVAFFKSLFWNRSVVSFLCIAALLLFGFNKQVFNTAGFYNRNFYGVIRISESGMPGRADHAHKMYNGITLHGVQLLNPELRREPVSYYGKASGVGRVFSALKERYANLTVGIVGLGVGTLATYGRSTDDYYFFEINPDVRDLALGKGGYFSYIADSPVQSTIIMGDGRLSIESLEKSLNFDILVLDAFSSDSIPVHMLTLEAIREFASRLKRPYGVLAIHISNQHLSLQPVCASIAQALGLSMTVVSNTPDKSNTTELSASTWALLAHDADVLSMVMPADEQSAVLLPQQINADERFLWTDTFSNLYLSLLERRH